MMKKFFSLAAIAAVVASMTLTACGPSSPEDYAKKVAELNKELKAAEEAGDQAKVDEINKEAEELAKELEEKCKDAEFKAAFEKAAVAEDTAE